MKTLPTSLVKDKIYCVNYLVFTNKDGVKEYAYVAVRQDNMADFREAVKRGGFDLEDFGLVLEHGKGEASETTREKMRMLYKCDHKATVSVLDYNPD